MRIEKVETGELTATLTLELSPEDYTPGLEKALKEQRRNATWPGFRPGQVPMSIVRKRVGRTLLVHEVERLIGESLNGYLQENQLRPLGQPLPAQDKVDGNNWDQPGHFQFHYDLALQPTFDVELNEKLGVEYPVVEVDDTLVDREITDMQRRFGKLEDAATAEAKDMLMGDLIELDADGSIKPGGLMNRTTISLEYLKDEATRQLFLGKAVGDEVRVDPHKVSDSHDDLARMLNADHEAVHHLQGDMLFRIAEIKRMVPVPVDQALFDRVYGHGAVADEAAFRERVREGLGNAFRRDSDRMFRRMVLKKLLAAANFGLPEAFLKRWILTTSEKPVTPEEVEQGFASYADGLRRELVEQRVVEKYGLEAKGEEIDAFAKRYVSDQFMQYGLPAPEGEELQRMVGRMLGDRDQLRRMRDTIVEQKLLAHFKNMLAPKEKHYPFDEFVNLARSV